MTILGLFLNNEIRTGGHRRYLELLEDLSARGHRVITLLNEDLTFDKRDFEAIRIWARYKRHGFPPASMIFRSAVRRELSIIRKAAADTDWILIHGETHLPAACFLKKRLGCNLLLGIRSNVVRWSSISMRENRTKPAAFLSALKEHLTYRIYEQIAAANADVLAFQSSYDRDDCAARAPKGRSKAVVIGGNIGEPRFKAEHRDINTSTSLKRLLFVGTLGERKGLRYLLEAMSLLKGRRAEALELDVLGRAIDLTKHQAYIERLGLNGLVHFQGRVSDPFPYYEAADLLVVPSLYDSYPDTVLEALHTGIPVIASRVGGIPDQLVHDELLVPPRNAAALADRIEEIARDSEKYMRLRELCSERREAFLFDWAEAWERAMEDYS
jgi:glycosyltransferase involved in cell wall biosynthesis